MNEYAVNQKIRLTRFNGRNCYRIGRRGALLVSRDNVGSPWQIVEKLGGELNHAELVRSYGAWTDKEVATGFLFWKKVERNRDGLIQADEVESFAERVAYSWESHSSLNVSESPRIDKLRLTFEGAADSGKGTLQELWVKA